jgi:hypothetical protein
VKNQLEVSQASLQLPTGLDEPHTATFQVRWTGAPAPSGEVVYKLVHQPAVSIPLSDGWYGTKVGPASGRRGGARE